MDRKPLELTPYRKVNLILFSILEHAEIGGMEPDDCGAVYESVAACLGSVCKDEGNEDSLAALLQKIQAICNATTWDTNGQIIE